MICVCSNLGWSGQLWADYLVALEKSNALLNKVRQTIQQRCAALLLSSCDRAQVEEIAVRAFENRLPGSE